MRNFLFVRLCVIISFLFSLLGEVSHGQISGSNWVVTGVLSRNFIENKSQFDGRDKLEDSKILFGVDQNGTQIYFTKEGLTYRFDEREKKEARAEEKESKIKSTEEHAQYEREDRSVKIKTNIVHMNWENANQNIQVITEDVASDYYSYTIGKENINYIKGYKKLIYKNLYPNIDVEYVFQEGKKGIKYSLILHPGADASQIKMKYSGSSLRAERSNLTLDSDGNIHIPTKFGDIIDHTPLTFYSGNKNSIIQSKFVKSGNTISFSLGNYDKTKTVVIDPWTQTPTLPNSNGVWECERDGAGNVYIIGGDSPMKLLKYNSAGVMQWTYSTPWDTANCWLGTLKTDLAGNSYITNGSVAAMQKINTSAGLVWNKLGGSYDEYWTIAFNCDQTKLITGGTRLVTFPQTIGYGYVFEMDINTGNIIDTIVVGGMPSSYIINEVRSISSSPTGKFYYLTLDTIGSISNFCSSPLFAKSNGYSFAYKCENFRPNNGNGGMSSIKANNNFVYTQNGININKRSLATGAIITTAAIPGGISIVANGRNQVGNSGIDIDSCGNVYVGSANQIIKYDANLNILSAVATSYAVSDVAVSNGGNVIVCGTTGTSASTSRTGYVQSINMSACNPMAIFPCCDASVCSAGYYCINSPADTLTPATSGGTWSGTGITDTSAGVFDPAVAGAGSHTIIYTLPCGTDSITIIVNSCLILDACQNTNGSITILNGTGPYTWYKDTTYQDCSQCFFPATCQPPAANCPLIVNTWISFATGTTVLPGSNFPILVISSSADSVQIDSLAQLPNCIVSVQENFTNGWNIILQNISSDDEITGTLFTTESATIVLEILDAQGKTIHLEKLSAVKGSNNLRVKTKKLANGFYFMKISDTKSEHHLTKKFIKE